MEIKTKSGFKCKVNENMVKDYNYVKALATLSSSKNEREIFDCFDFMITKLLGDEQKQKLIEHVSKKSGVAEFNDIVLEFKEITGFVGEQVKKSMSSQA